MLTKKTDQSFHVAVVAVSRSVVPTEMSVLAGEALEERLEAGEERHEQGGAAAAAGRAQRFRQLGREDRMAQAAGRLGEDGPRPVGEQLETAAPLSCSRHQPSCRSRTSPCNHRRLPGGEVGVLNGERCERRQGAGDS